MKKESEEEIMREVYKELSIFNFASIFERDTDEIMKLTIQKTKEKLIENLIKELRYDYFSDTFSLCEDCYLKMIKKLQKLKQKHGVR